MITDQTTTKKLAALKHRQIAATLKREQREAEVAREQAQGGRIKAAMPAKSARSDRIPPYCHLIPGRSPEEAARAAVADPKTPYPIDALAILWKLRQATPEPSEAPSVSTPLRTTRKRNGGPRCKPRPHSPTTQRARVAATNP
ncbi:MAG TPA: hypothetical protein VJ576_03450 [Rhodocyclaceae bacterium]|nr:hypothetical protein [Rhodocyclaceae bacterium]